MALNRRRVLRGMLNGSAVTVALPLLNCFLNSNGTALADGGKMPVRFGTWFWGLGIDAGIFVPKKVGLDYDLPDQIASWKNIKQHVNLFTGLTAFRDTDPNLCHYSGWVIGMSGTSPKAGGDKPGETLDTTISNQVGRTTRFKTLTAAATGDVRSTISYESAIAPTIPEVSPINFYQRLFGPDFQDPNAADFTPNPKVMARRSVLSGVIGEIKSMETEVGAEDKIRLDQYMTGLRHLERQFDQQLTKPEPIAACIAPKAVTSEPELGGESGLVAQRHKMMTDLMVMAVACDQTRVFNMNYSSASANTIKAGYEKPHHTTTHEEPIGEHGYQENAAWFLHRSMEAWAYYIEAFSKVKEGDGTLLDNTMIFGLTDHGYARVHSLDGMAAMVAGRAGGKIKTGLHIKADGATIGRIGYTAQRVMGLDINSWGTRSNNTSKEFGEILV
ncbi:MAG: DUF1552 domain-containing protein [Proteobacteria bacterium]|nr:DUF1552 domain-containing protein [Pseudomonadota bacterium]